MPSSATITAFYSFTANSRARASQVNSNFSIFRGHILPVDPNTQTAVNNTYDLGSSEYLWRSIYCGTLNCALIDLSSSTSTASLSICGDTSAASGAILLKFEGTERYRFKNTVDATTAASNGGFALRILTNYSYGHTTTSTTLPNSTITVASTGRPIELRLVPTINTSSASRIEFIANTIGGGNITLSLIRNGTTISSVSSNFASSSVRVSTYASPSWFTVIDTSPSVGDNTYFIQFKGDANSSSLVFNEVSFSGRQLVF